MRRLQFLTYRHRTVSTNKTLGVLLAFVAGAVNAGGFLALHMYTSHMTGFASQIADSVAMGRADLLLAALGALLAFLVGASVCAVLVNWGRRHRLRAIYALPLVLEAALLLLFGLMGAVTLALATPFAVPLTVLLLSFIMGLQNAVGSKTSGGSVRTTHMTGNITDLGMELGKLLYFNGHGATSNVAVRYDHERLSNAAGLVLMFVAGGAAGAYGFKTLGFICVLPLAALLMILACPPLLNELPKNFKLRNSQAKR